MLEGSPDRSQSKKLQPSQDSIIPLSQLGFASNELQILNSLSFEALENAALPTLERVFELTLDWRKANSAFIDLAQAFLINPKNEQLETQRRIVIAALNVTEELTANISTRTLPRVNLLINNIELIIESLSSAHSVLIVDEFNQLPLAYFALAESLHLVRTDAEKLEGIQQRIVMSLAQRVVPDLLAVDGLTASGRNGLTSFVRVLMSQRDIYEETINPRAGNASYWSDILFLAQVSKSAHLQPVLLNICEHLWDSCKRDFSLADRSGSLSLLSGAVAALIASGENQQSIELYIDILDNQEIRNQEQNGKELWYQAFLGLSIKSVSSSWEYLRTVVDDAINQRTNATDVLLEYLDIPGSEIALRAELKFSTRKDLVLNLASFFGQEIIEYGHASSEHSPLIDYKDKSPAKYSASRRKALATAFSDFDWKL